MDKEFIDKIAYIGDSIIPDDDCKIYYSKIDGSYLTRVGSEEFFQFLLKFGITEQIQSRDGGQTACIGFNPKEQKWYGWSHRAIFGYGIGSECKKGSCGYSPSNKEEFAESELHFWGDLDMEEDTYKKNPTVREGVNEGKLGVWVEYEYNDEVLDKSKIGQVSGVFIEYPEKWGKGEWTATTLEEAKQMAIDFARGVS